MITVDKLNIYHSKRLAEILSTDEKLNKELTPSKPVKPITAEEYYEGCKKWEQKTSSICFSILNDNKAIGSISISHINAEKKTAKCGYWVESISWGKGYATKAFEIIISMARNMNIINLTCSILPHNIASIRLWQRHGATIKEENGRVMPALNISPNCNVITHYDSLIDENNDPVYNPKPLHEYMDKWDGQMFMDELQLSSEKDVLEIGIGTGRLALKVCDKCKSFAGIDISPKTIEWAKDNLSTYSNVKLICDNFMDHCFGKRFDIIYSSLTFMHIEDKLMAINKVAGLLKLNGRFIFSVDKNQSEYIEFGERKIRIYPDNPDKVCEHIIAAKLVLVKQFETEFAVVFVAGKV